MRYVIALVPLALLVSCGGGTANNSNAAPATNSANAATPAGPVMMEERPAPNGAAGTVTRQIGPTLIPPADPRLNEAFTACAMAKVGLVPDERLNEFCTCTAEGSVGEDDWEKIERACAARLGVTVKSSYR